MKRPRHPFDRADIAAVQAALKATTGHVNNDGIRAVSILNALMRARYLRDAARGLPDTIDTAPAEPQAAKALAAAGTVLFAGILVGGGVTAGAVITGHIDTAVNAILAVTVFGAALLGLRVVELILERRRYPVGEYVDGEG